MTEVTKLGLCQMRSKTERPYPHQAVTEIWSIPFCESCAREQEAYFAIGELPMQVQRLASDPELSRRIAKAGKRQGAAFCWCGAPRTGKADSRTWLKER